MSHLPAPAPATARAQINCGVCGFLADNDDNFCQQCGNELPAAAAFKQKKSKKSTKTKKSMKSKKTKKSKKSLKQKKV